MFKSAIHRASFFTKEILEILRQPRLLLSLILGPFLILLIFGLSYKGSVPQYRVALVAPPDSVPADQLEKIKKTISTDFTLVRVDQQEGPALESLRRDEVDIVEILPTGIEENVSNGKQSLVKFKFAEINPLDESWMKYLGYTQISEINRILLVQTMGELQNESNAFPNLSPENVVSPLKAEYENSRGGSLSFVNFYAPSVLALILQHIAVTLGALSLVREQGRGTLEMFRVAAVSSWNVILGKYMGYTLLLGVLAAILTGLLIFLGTPFLGSLPLFALLVFLLIAASLGIGFIISCISNTDSAAVQLSMLTLLVSIFFSGFFLPLDNFSPSMHPLINAIPLTHAIQGLQNIMLKGTQPSSAAWIFLAVLTLVTYLVTQILFRLQLRRI